LVRAGDFELTGWYRIGRVAILSVEDKLGIVYDPDLWKGDVYPVLFNPSMFAFAAAAAPAQTPQNPMNMVWMILIMLGAMYFIMLRPKKREQDERRKMLAALKKGDRVVSIGGIHGKVAEIHDSQNAVSVEIAPKIVIKFNRTAIAEIERRDARSEADAEKPSLESAQ
jgi:preprotein translocase subunit YajC